MGERTPAPKRPFDTLSPPTPQHPEKKINLEIMEEQDTIEVVQESFPSDTPEWAKHLHRALILSINSCINFVSQTAEEAKTQAKVNKEDIEVLKEENEQLKQQMKRLEKRLTGLEAYDRRDNLIIHGVAENTEEDCASVVLKSLKDAGIPIIQRQYPVFTRIHRLPERQNVKGPRPIIMRFHHFEDRNTVWTNKNKLKGRLYITEDFPAEMKENRRKLAPYLAKAIRLPEVKKASLRGDRLMIDGKAYTADQLYKLPETDYGGAALATQQQDGVIAFFRKESPRQTFTQVISV